MKVLHISNYMPGYHRGSGGAEEACLNTVKVLYGQGVKNVVAAVKPVKQPKEKEFIFFPIAISEDLFGYKLSFLKRIFNFDVVSFVSLRKNLKQIKPDVVHLSNFDFISLSAISAV